MATRNDYRIPYEGLSDGIHSFQFQIGKEFIEENSIEDINSISVDVVLGVDKKDKIFTIDLSLQGLFISKCDRCLDKIELPIEYENRFIVKTGIRKTDEMVYSDDILYVKEEENTIDLYHYIYESIILNIPIKKTHPDDEQGKPTCNSEVMRILYRNNYKNEKNRNADPRWDALKNLNLE